MLQQRDMQKEFEKQLVQAQLEVQEQTFGELGRELHDNVGQLISSAKLLLGMTERNLPQPPETLLTAQDTLGRAMQSLRALSKSLNTEWLKQFNVIENLNVEAERINAANNLHLTIQSSVSKIPLQPEQQVMLFRIIQEAIHNSMKHARAKSINIVIDPVRNDLRVVVADDGKGLDTSCKSKGVGMINMRHRVDLLHGKIEWRSEPGKGTSIEINLPLHINTTLP